MTPKRHFKKGAFNLNCIVEISFCLSKPYKFSRTLCFCKNIKMMHDSGVYNLFSTVIQLVESA